MILTAWLCDYIWTGCAISQRKREILKYAILNICHGGSTNLIEIEIRIKWKKEGVHYSNFNIPAIKSQQCLYIVYIPTKKHPVYKKWGWWTNMWQPSVQYISDVFGIFRQSGAGDLAGPSHI